ncbi:hypothetical protein [Microbacterium sp. KNMS]
MDRGWTAYIHEVRSGQIEMPVELSRNSATTMLTGEGTGTHTIRAHGISRTLLKEITDGNRFGIAIGWADDPTYCAYQGVIQARRLIDDTGECVLRTRELPSAMFDDRTFFGVNQYDPVNGALNVLNKSYEGAVRAFLQACMAPSSEWLFPIDLPPDGAGTFTKKARHEEELTLHTLLNIVRAMGQEIDFRPYFSGDQVRYRTRVAAKIVHSAVTDLAARAPGSIVTGLEREDDWTDEYTGVGVFGNGQGQVRPYAYAPQTGSGATLKPVRDSFVTYPDIEVPQGHPDDPASIAAEAAAMARLQDAANAEYAKHKGPTEATKMQLAIWGQGPQIAEPGRILDLWSYGGLALDDGLTRKRVTGLRFDLSTMISPEVEDYAA